MMNVMQERRWRIGELARATGLTTRTLRHYHDIGLLVPSERSDAGYRLYTEGDIRRLYTIAALRHFPPATDKSVDPATRASFGAG